MSIFRNYSSNNKELIFLSIYSVVSCLPLWMVDYLPMMDLPQHTAQVEVLLNYTNSNTDYRELFKLNFFTPYLLGYALLYLLGLIFNLSTASKLILSLAFIANIFLSRDLLRRYGSHKMLVWLIIPVNYSLAFYYGYFTYVISIPVFLLFLIYVYRYLESPTTKTGVLLGLGSILLFFSHLILFGLAMMLACVLTYLKYGLKKWNLYIPYIIATPIFILWVVKTLTNEPGLSTTYWDIGLLRIPQLFSYTLGMDERPVYVILGLVLYLLPFVLGGKLTKNLWRWAPFSILLLIYLFVPVVLGNILHVSARIVQLVFLFYLVLFDFKSRPALFRISTVAVYSALLTGMIVFKFAEFNKETEGYKTFLSSIPENKHIASMVFVTKSNQFTGLPIYLHFPVWYQSERLGVVDYNFALLYPQIVRYRENEKPKITYGFDTHPYLFDWTKHEAKIYDYFLVRSKKDITKALFKDHTQSVQLVKNVKNWWLYRNLQ